MGIYGTFAFFAACCLLMGLMILLLVPETKGVPLEAMGAIFAQW